MATKKVKGYIVLEIIGVLLAVLLYFILTVPPKIWNVENAKQNECRLHMKSLAQAEKYYFQKHNQYQFSVDTLVQFIQQDSIIQNNRKVVEYSRLLFSQIKKFYDIPLMKAFYRIHSAIYTIKGDYIQNETYLEVQDTVIRQIKHNFDHVIMEFNKLYDPAQFKTTAVILNNLVKIDSVYKNINDFKIQNAAQLVVTHVDSVYQNLNNAEFTAFINKSNEVQGMLYDLITEMKKTKLARITNLPDRLKKFTDQIKRATNELPMLDLNAQVGVVGDYLSRLKAIHDDFITPEKFMLTNRYASLALSEEDSLLIKLSPEFATCPDSKENYMFKLYGPSKNVLLIECPNLQTMAKELVLPIVETLEPLKIRDAWKILQKANDSLAYVLDNSIAIYRKSRVARDMIFAKKDVETMLNLFYENTPLSFKYSKQLDIMVDTLKNDFRISLLKAQLEENLNGLDTLATRCEKQDFLIIDEWAGKVVKSAEKLDSALLGNVKALKRRDQKKVKSIMPVVEFWKNSVKEFETIFTSDQTPVLKAARKNLEEAWKEKIQKGRKETTKIIFKETHKNHGFVDNGQYSWEMR
jgi:competence protein ComGC